ncbi:MAG: helix-turn-helix transcriptional regulator [Bacteroidota bacterium]
MKKSNRIYQELSKKYTDEEIVESFVFNETLTPEEQKTVDEAFRKIRLERLKNMSEAEILFGNLMKFKLRLQDYFKRKGFEAPFSFSSQLKNYIRLSKKNNKDFADNIGIHPTTLSRIANGKENPNTALMYRLEKHSNGEIPAHFWWKLHARELEHAIRTDLEQKIQEGEKVKEVLVFG